MAEGVAATHRGNAECIIRRGEPAVINDAVMVSRFQQLVHDTAGPDAFFSDRRPPAGSDDFGFYAACVPSIYFWFGSRAPGNESYVHTPTFGACDDLIIPTTELTVRYILDLLNC
ncbi:M20/M25/M40 family metallo-hydrolase [Bradyrhizobium sp. CCBAU 11445]|uniref:M20/M25/M40 family metallo-hydrolase n=1 Tax=Bradyrhizobium sp. CCBAU 11445 TaxID=1630896 RepID=UPI0023056BE6|nr:M20/M25/M40 family metallo-hydrolase [Bradyrhizobium sp. CCBAU 11445]